MYIYAVDPVSNAIIDMETLQKSLLRREMELKQELSGFKVLEVGEARVAAARSGRLSTMEISVVALGCIVFVGACTTALCILCVRRNRRKRHKPYSQQRLTAFSTDHFGKYGGLFPSGGNQCQELNQSYSEGESYVDVMNHGNKKVCPHGNTVEEFGKAHQKCVKSQYGSDSHTSDVFTSKHEKTCLKFNQKAPMGKRYDECSSQLFTIPFAMFGRKGQDTSITSLNSSGQDSGIAEAGRCPCGQSGPHTSEESSGCSYEDSLKSNHNQVDIRLTGHKPYFHHFELDADRPRFPRRASFSQQGLDNRKCNFRRQSFSENMQRHFPPPPSFERIGSGGRITKQISSPNIAVLPTHPYFMNNKRIPRRKEAINEPVIDYDQSEGDDVFDRRIGERRRSKNHRRGSKLMEIGGQPAVFVATPAAAEIMRRQGADRFMLARPL
ncbi:hypothetical protein EVAR_54871_1 [Eumeta japonica]|uniref:Uncharacterized protein n=1 Tax=Eumeta variegata TaxID=151549 RepID=A0A4C1YGQ7_EUMVA|nr:hypothetical protein EVAR_54871_1 [Eumeta japonica]